MPGRITELSETQIVADLLADRRRLAAAATSIQMPQPAKDTFTVAATPATTYTLTAIPYQGTGGSSLNLSLNGVELIEGADYTVDYTTAIVTVSATLKGTPTPADVLTADYWTTGDLIALTAPADLGSITDNFNRPNASTLGTTSDGSATWTDQALTAGTWQILSSQAYLNGTQGAGRIATIPAGYANGTLTLDVLGLTSSEAGGPCFRYSDNNNFWFVECLSTAGTSSVYKKVANIVSAVGSPFTISGGTAACEVDLSGSSVIVKVNGTTVLAATDSFNSTATVHGIYATGGVSVRIDNFNWVSA